MKEFEKQKKGQMPIFITSLPHLSFLSLNQISCDVNGMPIARGDREGTEKRIEVVREQLHKELDKYMADVSVEQDSRALVLPWWIR